ncbi:hypothetical protein N7470_007495 [Penicillium chermesinum]|nr:hypothetical protein N7470_007495 [Penicillium chermesinum]
MGNSPAPPVTSTEEVPSYQELYEEPPTHPATGVIYSPRPENIRTFFRSFFSSATQYSRIIPEDNADVEYNAHSHVSHSTPIALVERNPGRDHTHCEVCDKIMERTHARQNRAAICKTVSKTFIILGLWLTLFGIFAVIFI